jgi:antitoxin (DNA-binding transcriptional repressor) of toxin-antitoxin stability system
MLKVGLFEAKNQLGELALRAAAGEVVVLKKRGKALAEIRALGATQALKPDSRKAIAALRKSRATLKVWVFDLALAIAEGRR